VPTLTVLCVFTLVEALSLQRLLFGIALAVTAALVVLQRLAL
jgi:hypothetical protein